MALLDSELARIKVELGYNVLTTGAVPYIGVTQIFEQVIQSNVGAGATTTSSTTVAAASTPTAVTLTLASGTGFSQGDRVVIDVDSLQEVATAQSISGASLVVILSNAHTGTYPVTVEGGETLVREALTRIREVKAEMATTFGTGSIKQIDEISFYQGGSTSFGSMGAQLRFWRNELAYALGIPNMWEEQMAGGQRLAAY